MSWAILLDDVRELFASYFLEVGVHVERKFNVNEVFVFRTCAFLGLKRTLWFHTVN